MTLNEVAETMARNLLDYAKEQGVSLNSITASNFYNSLDDAFHDGGEARCEEFGDLCWDYCLQFGEFGSNAFEDAASRCRTRAIEILLKKLDKA